MSNGLQQAIGKTIASAVIARNERSPNRQLFLVFTDGTTLELWGDTLAWASGLDPGGEAEAIRYAKNSGADFSVVKHDAG